MSECWFGYTAVSNSIISALSEFIYQRTELYDLSVRIQWISTPVVIHFNSHVYYFLFNFFLWSNNFIPNWVLLQYPPETKHDDLILGPIMFAPVPYIRYTTLAIKLLSHFLFFSYIYLTRPSDCLDGFSRHAKQQFDLEVDVRVWTHHAKIGTYGISISGTGCKPWRHQQQQRWLTASVGSQWHRSAGIRAYQHFQGSWPFNIVGTSYGGLGLYVASNVATGHTSSSVTEKNSICSLLMAGRRLTDIEENG